MPVSPLSKELLPQESKLLAQFIAMAPFVFQAARCLRDFGVLEILINEPASFSVLKEKTKLSEYGLSILLDAGESSGIVVYENDVFKLTQTGQFLQTDPIAKVNMDFTHDVCYQGLFSLKESIENGKPEGLKVFGKWNTIYEGLSSLPKQTQDSWFAFDHFFSDESFPRALPFVFKDKPRSVMDVGGNTGKFAVACAQFDPSVKVTIVDHPAQISMANENIHSQGLAERVRYFGADLLNHSQALPDGHDVIWMSQFLDCFGEDDIVKLLKRARQAMHAESFLFIMEPFTDNQKFNVAKFCLDMTSLYFTAMANGNSRMYRYKDFLRFLDISGLEVVESHNVRVNHTLLKCRKKPEPRQG
jgi:hypothetical protein